MTTRAALKEGDRVFKVVCDIISSVNTDLIKEAKELSDGTAAGDLDAMTRSKAIHDTCTEIIRRFNEKIDKGEL